MISRGFVFMISAVAILAALYLGGTLFVRIGETALQAEVTQFERNIKENFEEIGFAGTRELSLVVPSQVNNVCFADISSSGGRDIQHDLLEDLVQNGENVFLLDNRNIIYHFRMDDLRINQAVKCFEPVFGKLNVIAKAVSAGKITLE